MEQIDVLCEAIIPIQLKDPSNLSQLLFPTKGGKIRLKKLPEKTIQNSEEADFKQIQTKEERTINSN